MRCCHEEEMAENRPNCDCSLSGAAFRLEYECGSPGKSSASWLGKEHADNRASVRVKEALVLV